MKCFGEKSRCLHCKIMLLDDQELFHEVLEMTTGQDILEKVFQHLNLIETAYFGLRYLDGSNQTHWLEPTKRIVKQMKGSTPYTLYFSVKFYAADPSKLAEEITRYQLFLQVKQDILQGRLPVPHELAAQLGAYAVQSELGDFDPERHPAGYISEFRFVANQSTLLEEDIAAKHKQLLGMVPSDAEAKYLEKVMWLDMYGVDLHPVLGEDNIEYFLGLTPAGVIVLRNKAKVGNYFWPRITKVYFRGKFFMLRVRDKNNSEKTYGFETPSKSACKHLWRCCVEHHAFFRLTQSAATSPQALFSLHSTFSGRTEKEALLDAQSYSRPQPHFTRQPSRKFQRRILGTTLNSSIVDCGTSSSTLNTLHPLGTGSATSLPAVSPYNGTNINNHNLYRNGSEGALPPSTNNTSSTNNHTNNKNNNNNEEGKVDMNESRTSGTISPSSLILTSITNDDSQSNCKMSRRASSADSQSSADSRGHRRRRRRSRHRSSDCESEGSNGSKSRHRRHHHRSRHNSNDSCERHRHRRHRHRNTSRSSAGSTGEAELHWGHLKPGENTGQATMVKDLSKSGYLPSGHDTESDFVHHHSSKRRHRKHRSRSRSPSEAKHHHHLPDELKPHINLKLQGTDGLTHAELKDIPYTRIETAKNIKIKYSSTAKTKKHKNNKKDKGLPSDLDGQITTITESPPPPYTALEHQQMYKWKESDKNHLPADQEIKKEIPDVIQSNKALIGKAHPMIRPTNGPDPSVRRLEHPRVISMIPPTTHTNYYHNERSHYTHNQYDRNQYPKEIHYQKDPHYPHSQLNGGHVDPSCDVTSSIKPDQPSPQSSETSGISIGSSAVSMISSPAITYSGSTTPQHDCYTTSNSFNLRPHHPYPAKPNDFESSDQPHSLPQLSVSYPHSQLSNHNRNNQSAKGYLYGGDANLHSYSASNDASQRSFTLPKCLSKPQRPSNREITGSAPLYEATSIGDPLEGSNTLSKRYSLQNGSDSLTENIDLVNIPDDQSQLSSKESCKTDSSKPMPHPRSSRLSPASDPDYANSYMVQTMKRMDNKIRNSPSICSANTIGISPSTPTESSINSDNQPISLNQSHDSNHSLRFDELSHSHYLMNTKSNLVRPIFSNSPQHNSLSESSYNSRCESLSPDGNNLKSYNNRRRCEPGQSMTWGRGATTKQQPTVILPEHRSPNISASDTNSHNAGAHWKVYNWDTGRSNIPNNPISSTEQLAQIGQRNPELSRRGRRGSAGSLELILGPLIQSALQNQQR